MGQRHQVYVFLHEKENNTPVCKAFHNQWCYGSLPLRHVQRVAQFQRRADKYSRFSSKVNYRNDPDVLKAILSLSIKTGEYYSYSDINSEVTTPEGWINPDLGDNNDGITLMYVPQGSKRIKYCFMFLRGYSHKPGKKPLSAKAYVEQYYNPATQSHYKAYGIPKLITDLGKHCDLLTLAECYNLLPDWFRPEIERANIKKATRCQLPLYADCLPENKKLYEKRLKEAL
jgi:hypothetical protein